MVDKCAVKDYVKEMIGEEYIIPTVGVWNKVSEIDFQQLPNQFVLKCTHDSGGVIICKDRSTLDIEKTKRKIKKSLRRDYYLWAREWPYKNVSRRIIAEQYMQNGIDKELTDYKFFCFNGRAEFCQVIANRHTDETIDFYDREWRHQPFIGLCFFKSTIHHASCIQHVPQNYDMILKFVDKLAGRIASPFVRIDFYVINGHPFFGEITFFPNGGYGMLKPKEWNWRMGEMIELPKKSVEER